jgi:SAM-dependent methyltransferase
MAAFDAEHWDERYRGAGLVWSAGPNQFVEAECADLPPGRALDLACGEGRNAVWLAARGWHVTGVDFSAVALEKAAAVSVDDERLTWVCADVLTYRTDELADLIVLAYLQVSETERRQVLTNAVADLAPGGVLLLISHDLSNFTDGVGGPQNPAVLTTPVAVAGLLEGEGLVIDRAEVALRIVANANRPARDTIVRAHRPI